ncbi:MAG: hypothetical protein K2H35_01480 [Muribaculaceae bacterium]|nr:hypothetical protein [Muribaculaceae bacterium]
MSEVTDNHISAFEIKAGKVNPKPPKAFAGAYPEADFSVINRDTYISFIK